MQIHRLLSLAGRIVLAAAMTTSAFSAAVLAAADTSAAADAPPADLIFTGGKIYTVDPARSVVEAMAVRDGKIVFAGSAADAKRWTGPHTKTLQLAGRLVLPGLFDSHIHPIGIIPIKVCDLDSARKTLRQLSAFVQACAGRFKVAAGGWLSVHQWNFSDGNQPDAEFPTLRAALDMASNNVAIQLLGNDGHHGAFNSIGLSRARNKEGTVVGLSKQTLAGDFRGFAKFVGVDADGNPNGAVNEDARNLLEAPDMLFAQFPDIMRARAQMPHLLNAAGITGIMDALVTSQSLELYDALQRDGVLTVRATLAQFYDPERMMTADGRVDYEGMLASAQRVRAKYAANPLIRADVVKLFGDGVMEGNPYATPPTLPDTLALHPYRQPIFGKDKDGRLTVSGYVDTDSPSCADVRANPAKYATGERIARFTAEHHFHPGQCAISSGQLQHDRTVIMEFVKRFHLAGFTLHIHVIGDGTLTTVLDALEAARAADGISSQFDGLAHVQLAQPSDVARIGKDHLFVAFTYSWANADPEYDMTVVPFVDKVIGNSYSALHATGSYYESNVYPFKAVKDAGGTLVAGSDAPVNTRDPQPFVNMAIGVTRRLPGQKAQNPAQAVGIRDMIDAYTINGARFLHRDQVAGSLEAGKSADFIVLDQDILELAATDHADDIARTRVLETWFQGTEVYSRPAQ
jgi:predicted amidohydrolase YtcJ